MQTTLPTGANKSPSSLLALPAEIRNRIMEFALTSSGPLYHRPPHPRNTHQLNQVRRHHRLVEEKHMVSNTPHFSFNTVKLVCRQLYAETAGLELQHNSILFKSHSMRPHNRNGLVQAMHRPLRKSAESSFFDFVTPMTPTKLEWLSTVIIASDHRALSMLNGAAPPMENLSMLAHFCKQNPKIKMRYQFPNFCFDHSDPNPSLQYLGVGTALIWALQGDEAGIKAAGHHLPFQAWARVLVAAAIVWRDTWGIDYVLRGVENFSFTPKAEADTWTDDALIGLMRKDAVEMNGSGKMGKVWAKHMLEWKADGITAKK